MSKLFNRAKMTTATTGTGNLTLGSAASGFVTFATAGVVNGDKVRYCIEAENGTDFEVGEGSYTASGTVLSRADADVQLSSNSNNRITLAAGTHNVFITAADSDFTQEITVTVANAGAGNKYVIDGTSQQIITLLPSITYRLDQSDSTNASHPLVLASGSADGSTYSTGVRVVGTPGSKGSYTEVKLEQDAPALWYKCSNHSNMGSSINLAAPVSAGSSTVEVANIAALQAISNPAAGDQALVTSTNNLYIRKSSPSGWFKIATITNTNPQNFAIAFSGGGSGTASAYALAADGSTTTTVTSSATADPEGETISFGVIAGSSTTLSDVVSDGGAARNVTFGGNTIATISQSGSVFTLTPHASNAATGVNLNFTATDGVNTAVESAASFNLAFTTYAYGDRGITAGGDGATASRNRIEYYSIPTSGTVSTFGNLTFNVLEHAGVGNGSRVAFGGGRQFYATTDTIDYIVTATTGNAVDHGNLTEARWGVAAAGNVNRSLFSGGRSGTSGVEINTVDYKDISTAANCSDFGNLTNAIRYGAGLAGETRALFAGGVFTNNSGAINIDYFTIGSAGNATDFGDLVNGSARVGCGATSNNVRGLFVGGAAVNNQSNHMDYVAISTPSNATDFGNLATAVYSPSGAANDTYATFAGGNSGSNPYRYTTIQRVAIATLGNASAFGNIADAAGKKAGASGSAS